MLKWFSQTMITGIWKKSLSNINCCMELPMSKALSHLDSVDRSWSVLSSSPPPPLPRSVWASQSSTLWVVLVPSSLALAHFTGMNLILHSRSLKSDWGGCKYTLVAELLTNYIASKKKNLLLTFVLSGFHFPFTASLLALWNIHNMHSILFPSPASN